MTENVGIGIKVRVGISKVDEGIGRMMKDDEEMIDGRMEGWMIRYPKKM